MFDFRKLIIHTLSPIRGYFSITSARTSRYFRRAATSKPACPPPGVRGPLLELDRRHFWSFTNYDDIRINILELNLTLANLLPRFCSWGPISIGSDLISPYSDFEKNRKLAVTYFLNAIRQRVQASEHRVCPPFSVWSGNETTYTRPLANGCLKSKGKLQKCEIRKRAVDLRKVVRLL